MMRLTERTEGQRGQEGVTLIQQLRHEGTDYSCEPGTVNS